MEEITRRMEECSLQNREALRIEIRYLVNSYMYGSLDMLSFPLSPAQFPYHLLSNRHLLHQITKEELYYANGEDQDERIIELLINVYLSYF